MKNLTLSILIGAGLAISGCSANKGDSVAEAAKSIEMPELLNPNLLSAESLAANLPMLSDDARAAWIASQPFTDAMSFHAFLGDNVADETRSQIYQIAFLPMDLNSTPEADFMIIPGVGEKMAHEFEEYRPYSDMDQFDREIGKYVDAEELARLRRYVVVTGN